jgi:uncharacterized membrane-anchored protein YjiN (DUF445 family)
MDIMNIQNLTLRKLKEMYSEIDKDDIKKIIKNEIDKRVMKTKLDKIIDNELDKIFYDEQKRKIKEREYIELTKKYSKSKIDSDTNSSSSSKYNKKILYPSTGLMERFETEMMFRNSGPLNKINKPYIDDVIPEKTNSFIGKRKSLKIRRN